MNTVGSYEAKTHLAELIDRAARGERITITRHGVPVAMLVPPEGRPKRTASEVIDEFREYRKKNNIRLRGLSIRKMIEEGRR